MNKEMLIKLNGERLVKMANHARNVANIIDNETLSHTLREMKIYFRVADGGITLISLNEKTPQRGFYHSEYKGKDTLRSDKAKRIIEWVQNGTIQADAPGKPTPEKAKQSYLIADALYGGKQEEVFQDQSYRKQLFRRMTAIEECVGQKIGDIGSEVYFVTDELAIKLPSDSEKTPRVVCDILALRVTAEGKHIPMIIELKSERAKKELLSQLKCYAEVFEVFASQFQEIYSNLLKREVTFAQQNPERWIVWPYNKKDPVKFSQKEDNNTDADVYIVGYDETGECLNFL